MKDDTKRRAELADFLRTRRARLHPEQFELSTLGRRRTPGLRREEVAQLAGVGVSWYTWLEQGRDITVSEQVLESLARILQLEREERRRLFVLARGMVPVADGRLCFRTQICTITAQPLRAAPLLFARKATSNLGAKN